MSTQVMKQALDALKLGKTTLLVALKAAWQGSTDDDFLSHSVVKEMSEAIAVLEADIAQPVPPAAALPVPAFDVEAAIARCGSHRNIPQDVVIKIRAELLAAAGSKATLAQDATQGEQEGTP